MLDKVGLLANTKYTEQNIKPMFYVYVHYRNDNNQPFYIGKGKNQRAFSKHSRSNHWKNIVSKHGFTVKILFDNLIEEDAFIEEIKLIERFRYAGINIINKTNGGEGNSSKRSLEWRHNHSLKIKAAAARGAYKKKSKSGSLNPFWGKTHSDEQKKKWSTLRKKYVKED